MTTYVIVLMTKGKHDSVDSATVRLFETNDQAYEFIEKIRTGKTKHWVEAEIVNDGYELELYQPDF